MTAGTTTLGRVLAGVACLTAVVGLLAGCGEDRPRGLTAPVTSSAEPERAPAFDPDREPAAAVLALVPDTATTVTVTDFDQVRVQLGVPDLTSGDLMTDRLAFWERVAREAPLLTRGLLREDSSELELDHGFSQDDVDWEARFTGPGGPGFVLAFRPDLDMGAVAGAVRTGVGPLAQAQVRPADHLLVSGVAEEGEGVWATDPTWRGLVGEPAEATYLHRGCLPLQTALGPEADAQDQAALLARHDVTDLEDLAGFSVAFGDHNATVRIGPDRLDLFQRLVIGEDWPLPDFPSAYRTAVGDPSTGRIGYQVPNPPRAAALALLEELPVGVCNEVEPFAEPTAL